MKNYVLIIEQYINYKSQVIYIILQSNRIYHLTNYLVSVIMLLLQYIAFWAIILCSSQFLVESKFFDKTRNPTRTQCQGKKGKRIFYLIYETNILNDNCFILIFDDTYILAQYLQILHKLLSSRKQLRAINKCMSGIVRVRAVSKFIPLIFKLFLERVYFRRIFILDFANTKQFARSLQLLIEL